MPVHSICGGHCLHAPKSSQRIIFTFQTADFFRRTKALIR
uniref:Uncharacterized protein n=1 Tax=Manihot esculenta TaxID=3983 RepID=A0A2C9VPW7_MANES